MYTKNLALVDIQKILFWVVALFNVPEIQKTFE